MENVIFKQVVQEKRNVHTSSSGQRFFSYTGNSGKAPFIQVAARLWYCSEWGRSCSVL